MSKIARRAVRASIALGLVAGAGFIGASTASAASPWYTCTTRYPAVCLGVYYTVDSFGDTTITHEQVQADVNAYTYYDYTLITPDGRQYTSPTYYSGNTAGWGQKWYPGFTETGVYQAAAGTGSTRQLLGPRSDWAQVAAY